MTQVGGHLDSQELHVAGATVRHDNPFADLQVPVCNDMDFRIAERWVVPIYFGLENERAEQFVQEDLKDLDATIIENLLSRFDWRCRIAAAYLIALRGYTEFDDWMGKLLLRSDVCFAGKGYCLAFAIRPRSAGIAYLNRYLQYYLSRSDLFLIKETLWLL